MCVCGEVCVSGMCVCGVCWFVCSVCGVGEMYMYIVCLCAVCLWCDICMRCVCVMKAGRCQEGDPCWNPGDRRCGPLAVMAVKVEQR